jgi:hypothetical protein
VITYLYLFGLMIANFVFGFALVIGGAVLELSGKDGVVFLMPGLLGFGVGVLACWSGVLFKQQSERIARLEAQLQDRANP